MPKAANILTVQGNKTIWPNSGATVRISLPDTKKNLSLAAPFQSNLTILENTVKSTGAHISTIEVMNISAEPITLWRNEELVACITEDQVDDIKWEHEEELTDPLMLTEAEQAMTPKTVSSLTHEPKPFSELVKMIKLGKYASDDYAKDGIDEALAGEDPSGRNRGVRTRLFEILEENKEVFSTHRYDIGLFRKSIYCHDSFPLPSLPSTKRFSPYPAVGAARDNLLDTLQRMEKAGVLKRNLPSPYSLPIFLAQKKSTPSKSFFQHTDLNVSDSENSEKKDSETDETDVNNVENDNIESGEGINKVEEKNEKITNENNIKGQDKIKADYVRKVLQVRRDPELHQIVTDYHIIELQVQQFIAMEGKKGKKEKDK